MEIRQGTISKIAVTGAEVIFEDADGTVTAELKFGYIPTGSPGQPSFSYAVGNQVVCVRLGNSWADGVIICKVGG